VDPHRRAELRSLAYHRAIAERIASEPELVRSAQVRVAAWRSTGAVSPAYVDRWDHVLSQSADEIRAALTSEDESMTAARQSSPFAGALAPRERWHLWRTAAQ